MTEINIFPKFLDNALSPVATSVGNTLSSVWNIVFGGLDSYSQKLEIKRIHNLNKFKQELEEKVSAIPEEKLVEPPLHILGPTLEASKFYFESKELRAMFANLIASSINIDLVENVHPAFIEVIKQLNPDEAKILKYLEGNHIATVSVYASKGFSRSPIMENFSDISYKAECDQPHKIHAYLDNLNRLGLINLAVEGTLSDDSLYNDLIKHQVFLTAIEYANGIGQADIIKGYAQATMFGKDFYNVSILKN